MQKIQIVPVIEIRGGKTVEGMQLTDGECEEVETTFKRSSSPLELAQTYEEIGFREVFIEDLDGILNDNPQFDVVKEIAVRTELDVMVDIGVWSPEDLVRLVRAKPVISSESFTSLNLLDFPRDFVLAIETKGDELLSGMNLGLTEFIDVVKDSKRIKEVLVMDISRDESGEGPNLELCRKVIGLLPGKKIFYGGGVRHMKDIKDLYDLGVRKAFVGAALHSGEMLKEIYAGFEKEDE